MARSKTCIFCDKSHSKAPSKEDVLARWIAAEFPEAYFEITQTKSYKSFKSRGNLGILSRHPCTGCNNGWMSDLENEAKPLLAPMMNGTTLDLTTSQQLVIAKWFTKTIMVYEFMDADVKPYFGRQQRNRFYKSLLIPPLTFIFLAAYMCKGRPLIRTRSHQFDLIIDPKKPSAFSVDAFSATFVINHVVLQ